ncbi:MAG: type I-C CRISPR-associated protein Cas5c [Ignavibacteriaceae bacterium]
MNDNKVRMKVWGDYACFTRPDLKVERMTYPCMTPSAARGILDSILWKPEFKWYVHKIFVLNPVKFASVKRNEINSKQGATPIYVDEVNGKGKPLYRAQRNSIILKDVAYIIEASIFQKEFDADNPTKKYIEMFNRRVRKGQCWRRPYFGTREFAVEFILPTEADIPIQGDIIPIGSMFLDMWYDEKGIPHPKFFYDVAVRNGVLDCSKEYEQILSSNHPRGKLAEYPNNLIHEFNITEEVETKEEV